MHGNYGQPTHSHTKASSNNCQSVSCPPIQDAVVVLECGNSRGIKDKQKFDNMSVCIHCTKILIIP